ncbi:MAG: hypothetical protein LC768_15055 [Acidobacteria bacterium]|nr:hypothetical protein [Acidobacteriota bacterium]MCA1639625.1 hypothetical protein [Acidobacteriota bacterium]
MITYGSLTGRQKMTPTARYKPLCLTIMRAFVYQTAIMDEKLPRKTLK